MFGGIFGDVEHIEEKFITTPSHIISVAAAEIGTKELPAGSNNQKYGKWYGFNKVAWCAIFVSWVFDKAGLPLPAIQHAKGFAYCPFAVNYFKKNNQWVKRPQPADIVFFDFGSGIAKHVGIVEKVNRDGTVTTIEGNTGTHSQDNGGAVMRKTRYSKQILGYARPNYTMILGDRLLRLQTPFMRGSDVRQLQRLLNDNGYQIAIDEVFGNDTSKAVFEFQASKKLAVDGVVGKNTIRQLTKKDRISSVADSDIDILARTVYGEARGESRKGKIAVAHTIVNRVKSPISWWGKTVKEVCLHPMQYSCWNKNDPNSSKIKKVTRSNPNFEECYGIAKGVLEQKLKDESKGSTHYYAPSGVRRVPLWARGKNPVTRIGNHLFFKDIA